jgi:flagellar P-ring protein precursor FlgI
VQAPASGDARVAFMARLENLELSPGIAGARVIVNARTGSVVMNQAVELQPVAVAHGNLTVVISREPVISQPNPLSQGQTVQAERSQIDIKQDAGALLALPRGASLGEVVRALNAIGATPQDLLSILQAMRAAGALRAELEII